VRALLLLLLLAACASRAPPAAPEDPLLDQLLRSGARAIEAEQPAQAARIYDQALDRARQRDAPGPLGEAAYGAALGRLLAGDPRGARDVAAANRAELARRGISPPADLTLTEATARFRLGEDAAAAALLNDVSARAAESPDSERRALFLRGLIAERAGDQPALASARAALGSPPEPGFAADARELAARDALLRADAASAFEEAAAAAELRRSVLDYRGVARALALQGEAAARLGRTREAADLFLRAGRSAALRDEPDQRAWLARAEALSRGAAPPPTRRGRR
jgi:hypothetical protein